MSLKMVAVDRLDNEEVQSQKASLCKDLLLRDHFRLMHLLDFTSR